MSRISSLAIIRRRAVAGALLLLALTLPLALLGGCGKIGKLKPPPDSSEQFPRTYPRD